MRTTKTATAKTLPIGNTTKGTVATATNGHEAAVVDAMKAFLNIQPGTAGVTIMSAVVDGETGMGMLLDEGTGEMIGGDISETDYEDGDPSDTAWKDGDDQGTEAVATGDPDVPVAGDGDRSEGWREVLSETQKSRIAKLEAELKGQNALVKAGEDAEAEMERFINKAEAARKGTEKKGKMQTSMENELRVQKQKTQRVRDKVKSLTTAYDKIKDAATAKWQLRSEKDEKKLAEKAEAQGQNALAKADAFIHRALTGEEKQERDRIEAEMQVQYDLMRSSGQQFLIGLFELESKKLYSDYEGGFYQYCNDRWQMDKTYAFRQVQAGEQIVKLRQLLARPVQLLDSKGTPVKVNLDENKLPDNEAQLRALRTFGPGKSEEATQNQLHVWAQVVRTAAETNKPVTAKLITTTGDSMVAAGEIALGMDAELAKKTAERKAKEGKKSPLNFSEYIMRARWRGHTFDSYSLRDERDLKVFECHIDGVAAQDPNGHPIRFTAVDSSLKFLEEKAREIEPDMWGEDTKPAVPAEVTTNGTAKAAPAPAKKGKDWYVGYDGDNPEVFDVPAGEVPTTVKYGFDKIVGPDNGPFASKKVAEEWLKSQATEG